MTRPSQNQSNSEYGSLEGLGACTNSVPSRSPCFSGRELAPWNNCGTLRTSLGQNHLSDGNMQEAPGVRASESTRLRERTMGIESTSEVWESTKPFVGRSAAFMRPRRRRGSSEKARPRWQFRCIAAPRNHFVIHKAGTRIPAFRNAAPLPRSMVWGERSPGTIRFTAELQASLLR